MIAQEFADYIREKTAAGVGREDIKRVLKGNGVSEEDIEEGFSTTKLSSSPHSVEQAVSTMPKNPAPIFDETATASQQRIQNEVVNKTSRKTSKILLVLIGTVLVLMIVCTGAYYVMRQDASPQTTENYPAIPTVSTAVEQTQTENTPSTTNAVAQAQTPALSPTPYVNSTYGYQIDFPYGWTQTGSGNPSITSTDPNTGTSISIMVTSSSKSSTPTEEIAAYMQNKEAELAKEFPGFTIANQGSQTIAGMPESLLAGTWTDASGNKEATELAVIVSTHWIYEISIIGPPPWDSNVVIPSLNSFVFAP